MGCRLSKLEGESFDVESRVLRLLRIKKRSNSHPEKMSRSLTSMSTSTRTSLSSLDSNESSSRTTIPSIYWGDGSEDFDIGNMESLRRFEFEDGWDGDDVTWIMDEQPVEEPVLKSKNDDACLNGSKQLPATEGEYFHQNKQNMDDDVGEGTNANVCLKGMSALASKQDSFPRSRKEIRNGLTIDISAYSIHSGASTCSATPDSDVGEVGAIQGGDVRCHQMGARVPYLFAGTMAEEMSDDDSSTFTFGHPHPRTEDGVSNDELSLQSDTPKNQGCYLRSHNGMDVGNTSGDRSASRLNRWLQEKEEMGMIIDSMFRHEDPSCARRPTLLTSKDPQYRITSCRGSPTLDRMIELSDEDSRDNSMGGLSPEDVTSDVTSETPSFSYLSSTFVVPAQSEDYSIGEMRKGIRTDIAKMKSRFIMSSIQGALAMMRVKKAPK